MLLKYPQHSHSFFFIRNYRKRTNKGTFKLKKLHLLWVCRSVKEFAWILEEINSIENIVSIFTTPCNNVI